MIFEDFSRYNYFLIRDCISEFSLTILFYKFFIQFTLKIVWIYRVIYVPNCIYADIHTLFFLIWIILIIIESNLIQWTNNITLVNRRKKDKPESSPGNAAIFFFSHKIAYSRVPKAKNQWLRFAQCVWMLLSLEKCWPWRDNTAESFTSVYLMCCLRHQFGRGIWKTRLVIVCSANIDQRILKQITQTKLINNKLEEQAYHGNHSITRKWFHVKYKWCKW